MDGQAWLDEVIRQYRRHKKTCERAVAQVPDDRLFATAGKIPLSLAALLKHLGGNHRSRWRDFLTTDGEKHDRNRDGEFVVDGDSAESIWSLWGEGWRGQIVQLARHFAGDDWETLSVAPDETQAFNARMAEKWGEW